MPISNYFYKVKLPIKVSIVFLSSLLVFACGSEDSVSKSGSDTDNTNQNQQIIESDEQENASTYKSTSCTKYDGLEYDDDWLVGVDSFKRYNVPDSESNAIGPSKVRFAVISADFNLKPAVSELISCTPSEAAETACEDDNFLTGTKYNVSADTVKFTSMTEAYGESRIRTKLSTERPQYWKGNLTYYSYNKEAPSEEDTNPKLETTITNVKWNRDSDGHEYMHSISSEGIEIELNEYSNCSGNVKYDSPFLSVKGDWTVVNDIIHGNYNYCFISAEGGKKDCDSGSW